jgi:hypothetical protein
MLIPSTVNYTAWPPRIACLFQASESILAICVSKIATQMVARRILSGILSIIRVDLTTECCICPYKQSREPRYLLILLRHPKALYRFSQEHNIPPYCESVGCSLVSSYSRTSTYRLATPTDTAAVSLTTHEKSVNRNSCYALFRFIAILDIPPSLIQSWIAESKQWCYNGGWLYTMTLTSTLILSCPQFRIPKVAYSLVVFKLNLLCLFRRAPKALYWDMRDHRHITKLLKSQ